MTSCMPKIYIINRTDRVGYDEHDSHVVIADSEEEARALVATPDDAKYYWPGDEGSDIWYAESTKVTEVLPTDGKGIVLSSFNAG